MNTTRSTFPVGVGLRAVTFALALAAAAPAAGWAQSQPPASTKLTPIRVAQGPPRARLEVENNNWLDVHLYLVRDGMLTSIGFMNGPGQSEFELPSIATIPGSDVQILVLPIGGNASYLSPVVAVNPGEVVKMVVENNLGMSTTIISPTG